MKLRYREIHREEIKRRTYKMIDHHWELLLLALTFTVLPIAFGFRLILSDHAIFGTALVSFGAFAFHKYVDLLRLLSNNESKDGWLNWREHAVVILGIGLSAFLPSTYSDFWFVPLLIATAYLNARLWKRSRPFWRRWYFFAARSYFREIASYSQIPNRLLTPHTHTRHFPGRSPS